MIILSEEGKLIYKLDKSNGLKNNSILHIKEDHQNNLWLGLDNGISRVDIGSPFRFITTQLNQGAGYSALEKGDTLFLATNQGVFYNLKSAANFISCPEIDIHTWKLKQMRGEIYALTHKGAFIIEDGIGKRISPNAVGAWDIIRIDKDNYAIGTYDGIDIYHLDKKNRLEFSHKLNGYDVSSQQLVAVDNTHIISSHFYLGSKIIELSDGLREIKKIESIGPTNEMKGVLKTTSGHYLTYNTSSIFQYFPKNNILEPLNNINQKINTSGDINKIVELDDTFWIFKKEDIFELRFLADGNTVVNTVPASSILENIIVGNESVNNLSGDRKIIGSEEGFILMTNAVAKSDELNEQNFYTKLSNTNSDYTITNPHLPLVQDINFEYTNNNITVDFSLIDFSQRTLYSTFMSGIDEKWTTWSEYHQRSFNNLYEGTYELKIRAKKGNKILTPAIIHFSVFPPWYRTKLAYFGYLIMFISLVLFIIVYVRYLVRRKHSRILKREQDEHELKVHILQEDALKQEKKMMILQKEKLEEENKFKEQELTLATYHLIQRNEFVDEINNEINKLEKVVISQEAKNKLTKLLKRINKSNNKDDLSKTFEVHLEHVHQDFIQNLSALHPNITPREMRVCVYLRMNLSSKEIASLLGVSLKAIEVSRYRIRKKMNLERSDNLFERLLSI